MPTSHHDHIVDVIDIVRYLKPKSILDIGVGFGKWGFLCREYLDVMAGRPFPENWKIKIDGLEIFEPYIQLHQSHIYNTIHIGDCTRLIDDLPSYDLMIMGDVLEHIPKPAGRQFLEKAFKKCKAFILVIPLGSAWLKQGEMYGNKHEAHISVWEGTDFEDYPRYQLPKLYFCNSKQIALYAFKGGLCVR